MPAPSAGRGAAPEYPDAIWGYNGASRVTSFACSTRMRLARRSEGEGGFNGGTLPGWPCPLDFPHFSWEYRRVARDFDYQRGGNMKAYTLSYHEGFLLLIGEIPIFTRVVKNDSLSEISALCGWLLRTPAAERCGVPLYGRYCD